MSSLSHCLKQHNMSKLESQWITNAAKSYLQEGFTAQKANEGAIKDFIKDFAADREYILNQVKPILKTQSITEASDGKTEGAETPLLTFNPANAIKLVADDIESLRVQDIDRLLSDVAPENRDAMKQYIVKNHSDNQRILDEVKSVMDELGGKSAPNQQKPDANSQKNVQSAEKLDGKEPESSVKPEPVKTNTDDDRGSPAAKIEDFGEKIIGAKKEYAASYKDKLKNAQDVDVAAEPLSKSWPEPDYNKLIESGQDPYAVAVIRSMRDEIPNKPGSSWKQSRWVEQVKLLRKTADDLLNDPEFSQRYKDKEQAKAHIVVNINPVNTRAELYQLVGHGKSLKGIKISRSQYSVYNGVEQTPARIIWEVVREAKVTAFSNMPYAIASGATKQEALDNFKQAYASLETAKAEAKGVKFELYHGDNKTVTIGKKVGRNVIDLKTGFASVQEAREYRAGNQEELVKILEQKKDVPRERYDINQPRVGQDMRNAQDVTPDMFQEAFGFRGVQFGNYVEGSRRQQELNNAYDALMDMAAVLGIPPKSLSLNGELGLAFGARGSGGLKAASAHYEPGHIVINLTKGSGAGSLAHEWWHAASNYFARMRGEKDKQISEALDVSLAARGSDFHNKEGVRREMVQAFGAVVRAINSTGMRERSNKIDATRTKAYWGTGDEMAARAFERYVIAKLQDQSAANDYLANVVSEEFWNAQDALGVGEGGRYPYPTVSELPAIRGGFDKLFQTIESKETDQGVALYEQSPLYNEQASAYNEGAYSSQDGGVYYEVRDTERSVKVGGRGTADGSGEAGLRNSEPIQSTLFLPAGSTAVKQRRVKNRFLAQVTHAASGIFKHDGGPVTTLEQVARLASPIADEAQENNILILTDAQDMPVAVVRHSVGKIASAPVEPSTLVGMVHSVPGAVNLWIAHNHPSGSVSLSPQDKDLLKHIALLAKGTGIEARGIVAVTLNGDFAGVDTSIGFEQGGSVGSSAAGKAKVKGLVRKMSAQTSELTIGDSKAAVAWVDKNARGQSGFILLETGNKPVGFLPMAVAEMQTLRTGNKGSGASAILAATQETNATGAIVVTANAVSSAQLVNPLRFLDAHRLRVLDTVSGGVGGEGVVVATVLGRGGQTGPDAFFSKSQPVRNPANIEVELAQGLGGGGTGKLRASRLLSSGAVKILETQADAVALAEGAQQSAAFHGSPHDFDTFRSSAIGTGEGAQAYGYGLYFAGSKEVAEWYREKLGGQLIAYINGERVEDQGGFLAANIRNILSYKDFAKGKVETISDMEFRLAREAGEGEAELEQAIAQIRKVEKGDISAAKGRMYEVELAPQEDEYLLWDKPLSEQSDMVRESLLGNIPSYTVNRAGYLVTNGKVVEKTDGGRDLTGRDIYLLRKMQEGKTLRNHITGEDTWVSSDQSASEYLHSLGIRGIKYLDGSSRGNGDGNFNYVIFNENDVSITIKYAKDGKTIQGLYVNGQSYLVADGIEQGKVMGVLLHELGEHANHLGFAKDAEYQAILKSLEARSKHNDMTGLAIQAAIAAVPKGTRPEHKWSEVAAYLAENNANAKIGIVDRILNFFKKWLLKFFGKSASLNEKDVVLFARSAVRSATGVSTYEGVKQSVKEAMKFGPVDVKSENFKKWFGDWEAQGRHDIPVISLSGSEIAGITPAEARKNAKAYLSAVIEAMVAETGKRTVLNVGTGYEVGLTVKGATHGFVHQGEATVKAVAALRELIGSAAKVATNKDKGGSPDIKGVHTFVAPLDIGGDLFAVKLTVKENADGTFRLHDHEALGIQKPAGISEAASRGNEKLDVRPAAGSYNVTIAELLGGFKGGNTKYLPSAVVDEDGKPLMVYHGTRSDFDSFSVADGSASGATDAAGFHFTDNASTASLFSTTPGAGASRVVPVFLNIKNPLLLYSRPTVADAHKAKESGHDGLIGRSNGGIEYVVFRPEQIKSALSNTGAFSSTDPRIQYSMKGGDKTPTSYPMFSKNDTGDNGQHELSAMPPSTFRGYESKGPKAIDTVNAMDRYKELVATLKSDKVDIFEKQKELETHIKASLPRAEQWRVLSQIKNISKPATARGRAEALNKAIAAVDKAHARKRDIINQILSEKDILARRREGIKALRDYLGLTDDDLRKINRRDIRLMSNSEFKQFKDDMLVKAVQFADHKQAQLELMHIIYTRRLRKVENLQRAMDLPSINKMNDEQLHQFAEILSQYEVDDVFMGPRALETVDRNDFLRGIKTWREAEGKLAELTGTPIDDLRKIKVSQADHFTWDSALVNKNPMYKALVHGFTTKILGAQMRYLAIEKEYLQLSKDSLKSRKLSLADRLVPRDQQVFEFLEAREQDKAVLAEKMTKEQVALANYMQEYFGKQLEYLIEVEAVAKGRKDYFPHMRRVFLETWRDDGFVKAIEAIKKDYKDDSEVWNILESDTGRILPMEKFFPNALERTGGLVPSRNIDRAFLKYAQAMEKKRMYDSLIPEMEIYAQALTPHDLTEGGLEMDRSIKQFVHRYINNKKGRRISFDGSIKQGGNIDLTISSLITFTSVYDLGGNIISGAMSVTGEQAGNYVMMGARKMALGTLRQNTAKGRKFLEQYENFTGKTAWEEFSEPGKVISERASTALFALFHQMAVTSNKQFLLGSITDAEYDAGYISPERLADLQLDMGRLRVVPGTSSLVGSTSAGRAAIQYLKWAAPILSTILKDIHFMVKALPTKERLTAKEAREFYRIIGLTATVVAVIMAVGGDDELKKDKSLLGRAWRKALQESGSLLQAVTPGTWLRMPRSASFLKDLFESLTSLKKLTKTLLTPGAIRPFVTPLTKKEKRDELVSKLRKGDVNAQVELDSSVSNGTMSRREVKQINKEKAMTPQDVKMGHMSLTKALDAYKHANSAERDKLRPILLRKQRALKSMSGNDRTKMQEDLDKALSR